MERVLQVGDQAIPLRATAGTLVRYKLAFGRDAMGDLMRMAQSGGTDDFSKLDFDVFYRFLWVFAKTANPDLLPLAEWLDGIDMPPLDFVKLAFPAVQELLMANIKTTKTAKKK